METIRDLYVDELKDLHDAESQVLQILPKLIERVTSRSLAQALSIHYIRTHEHVQRLERIIENLGEHPQGKQSAGMSSLVNQGYKVIQRRAHPGIRDINVVLIARKMEHYQIAAYRAAHSHACMMGHFYAASLLKQTLTEEHVADQQLVEIAAKKIDELTAERQ